MIERLKEKHIYECSELITTVNDRYNDFYFTKDKNRIFIKDIKVIERIIKNQEVYGLFEKGLQGMMVVYREKGFRPYIKIFSRDYKTIISFAKFLNWNYYHLDLYAKIKKDNPVNKILQRNGFVFQGDRGAEILLYRQKKPITLQKVGAKSYGKDTE